MVHGILAVARYRHVAVKETIVSLTVGVGAFTLTNSIVQHALIRVGDLANYPARMVRAVRCPLVQYAANLFDTV